MSEKNQEPSGFEVWLFMGGLIAVIAVIAKGFANVVFEDGNYWFLIPSIIFLIIIIVYLLKKK
ncbi:MAG TPA: hypothetical protein VIH57_13830 [Bacteroidales bacterium]